MQKSSILAKFSPKKIILIILVLIVFLGMAVFGVNRYTSSSNSSSLIKVGKVEIPIQLFMAEYNLILQQNAAALQQNPYLMSNVLQGMISRYVSTLMFVNEANKLHIGASDDLVYKIISSTPYFQGEDKKFNKDIFQNTVSKIYGSEANYIATLKNDLKQTQLTGIILNSLYQPQKITNYFSDALHQTRSVNYVIFARGEVKNLGTPSNAELLSLRDQNKDLYTVPEFRSLEILEVNAADYLKNIKVSDQEIKNYYASHKNNFMGEETRDISQILLNNQKEADNLYKELKGKTTLKGVKESVTSLTAINKTSLPTPLANSVFDAKVGVIMPPIKTDLGYHIIVVNKINPSKALPLKTVEKRIRTEIIGNKLAALYDDLKNKLTTAASNGKSLKAIQKEFNSRLIEAKEVNKFGFDGKNNILTGPAQNQDILTAAFALPLNQISNVITLNNKFYLVVTTKIDKEHIKTLEEAKPDLLKQWQYNKATGIIKNNAEKFIETFNQKGNIKKLGVKVNNINLSRSKRDSNNPFNNQALDQIFLSKINNPVEGTLDNGDIYVAITKKITNPNGNKLTAQENKQVSEYIANNFKEDILTQLFTKLSDNYKVDVNQKALQSVMGDNEKQ